MTYANQKRQLRACSCTDNIAMAVESLKNKSFLPGQCFLDMEMVDDQQHIIGEMAFIDLYTFCVWHDLYAQVSSSNPLNGLVGQDDPDDDCHCHLKKMIDVLNNGYHTVFVKGMQKMQCLKQNGVVKPNVINLEALMTALLCVSKIKKSVYYILVIGKSYVQNAMYSNVRIITRINQRIAHY